ncbi:ATP-binding protein [Kitasatospora cinereorecta]|uniref:ATP-binding protein n=1 Tax=Kitasatospora cinereorecta TaxID=285560 RepID=A0ABW0V1N5_9ACTN
MEAIPHMGNPTSATGSPAEVRDRSTTPVAVPAVGTGRLPAEVAGFVGRRGELGEIGRLLASSRLLTLVGPGGVGKTRLALRAAAAAEPSFRDGVRLVELARLRDPLLLAQSVVDVLDVQDRSDRSAAEVLSAHLADRELLLVLDNCEHLAGPTAHLVETLLRAAPGLTVLATSRQALGVIGEHLFTVPPMRVPTGERLPGPRALLRYEAVSLFVQRASAVLPEFTVSDANADSVARLVAALDGLPLAIELAASWLRVLPVDEVLHRLTDRFALLDTGAVAAAQPARRTLRELMDWSFDLCSPQERLLWERVSVFSGGFDLAAAEAVCSGDGIPRSAVLALVAGLVDKSVLIRQETSGSVRCQLLETVREYGYGRLEQTGASTEIRRRHRDHFGRLADQAQANWFGADQVVWFDRLRADHANLRAALEFCVTEPGEADSGLALASTPRDYWVAVGSLAEGRQWLTRLLAAAPDDAGPVRTRAMGLNAWFAVLQGNETEAEPLLTQHVERAERLADASETAWALQYIGAAMGFANPDDTNAITFFEGAAAGHRELDDMEGLTSDLFMQAIGEALIGDVGRALDLSREAVSLSDAAGESFVRSYAIFSMALATWRNGDRAAATALVREAVKLKQSFHDRWGLALCVELTFWTAAEDGHYDRAAYLLGALHALWEGLGASLEESVPFMIEGHERYVAQVREALGGRALQQTSERGARLTPEQIVEDILRDETAPTAVGAPGARLTRRELQVAKLVAQGMSNKEIAAGLVISLRTVENHVEHVLAKLGFSSRTQVAVWVSQHAADRP